MLRSWGSSRLPAVLPLLRFPVALRKVSVRRSAVEVLRKLNHYERQMRRKKNTTLERKERKEERKKERREDGEQAGLEWNTIKIAHLHPGVRGVVPESPRRPCLRY